MDRVGINPPSGWASRRYHARMILPDQSKITSDSMKDHLLSINNKFIKINDCAKIFSKVQQMQVFLSWSGDASRRVAETLKMWLPNVIQNLQPWMSKESIGAGRRWNHELSSALETAQVGILCLTKQNLKAPWLLFEAGALAKTVEASFVIPYLLDIKPTDFAGPLAQFQAANANDKGTLNVLRTINNHLHTNRLTDSQLDAAFSKWWNDLEEKLDEIRQNSGADATPVRPTEEMVEEMLSLVRKLAYPSKSIQVSEIHHMLEGNDQEVENFLKSFDTHSSSVDINSDNWHQMIKYEPNSNDGLWYSRWNRDADKEKWETGFSHFSDFGAHVLITHKDFNYRPLYIIAVRKHKDESLYIGRCFSLFEASDNFPWVGKIINNNRIDGWWPNGRWDFRR